MWQLDTQSTANLLTAVLAITTVIYAVLTWRILRANSKMIEELQLQRESETRPALTVNVTVRHSTVLCLEISNRGRSPALGVRLRLDRDFFQFAEKSEQRNLRGFQAFKEPIPTFSPGDLLSFDLSQGFNLKDETLTPTVFGVEMSYGSATRSYSDKFIVDLRPYFGTHWPKTRDEQLGEMVDQLKILAKK